MEEKIKGTIAPKPLLQYLGGGKFSTGGKFTPKDCATEYWLYQYNGETYRLTWWCNGWTVNYQESYLNKDLIFDHKNDIPSFMYSHYGEAKGWSFVFETREEAIECFKKYLTKGIEEE